MNINKLKQFQRYLLPFTVKESKQKDVKLYSPNEHIALFIQWYEQTFLDSSLDDIEAVTHLIVRMASYYEKKFSDEELNMILPFQVVTNTPHYYQVLKDSLDNHLPMFYPQYMNQVPKEILSTNEFLRSLPKLEHDLLKKPKYKRVLFLNPTSKERFKENIQVTSRGVVTRSECLFPFFSDNYMVLQGMHVQEVLTFLKENHIPLAQENELEQALLDYKIQVLRKQRLLTCVMYQLIENSKKKYGSVKIGARRAFLFAKEFDLDLSIAMAYGIDLEDSHLKDFIQTYLHQGGRLDLLCQIQQNQMLQLVSLQQILDFFDKKEQKLKKKKIGQKNKRD